MLVLLENVLLVLCLVPAYSVRYKRQPYIVLSDGVDSVKLAYDALVQFHNCLTNVSVETSATKIPTVPQAKDDERDKVLQLLQKCFLKEGIVLTQIGTQIDCRRFIDATTFTTLSFPEQNRNFCISRFLDTSWDRVNVNYFQADKISTPVKNTCQIDCRRRFTQLHFGKTPTMFNNRGYMMPFRGNPNENQFKPIPKQLNHNSIGQTQRFTREEDRSQQLLSKNLFILLALGISMTLSALGCLGAGCYIMKRRQRATNNNVHSYVDGGNSDHVEFLTSREMTRFRAECQAGNARYCFDPTSMPRAALPPTASDLTVSNSLGISTLRAEGELEHEEGDFVNTRAVENNAQFLHTAGPSSGLINQLATVENNPSAFGHVTLKPKIFTAGQTDVKINEPDRTIHRLDDQPFWQNSELESFKTLGIKSGTSTPDERDNDSYKIKYEKKLVDPTEKKTYAKLHQHTKRRLVDYTTWVKGEGGKSKHKTSSENDKTTCRKKREDETCEDNDDQGADTEYTNPWIANEVGGVGFEGFEDIVDVENTSCSSSGSDVYINTSCEDLLSARRGGSPPSEPTPKGRSRVRCMAMDDTRTVHEGINTMGKYSFSRLDNWRNDKSGFVDLEDVDVESDSSEDRDIYLNTESVDLNTIRQRGVCPKRDLSSKTDDGSRGSKAGVCKLSVRHNADDDRTTRELTIGSYLTVSSDGEFYIDMSQIVNTGETDNGRDIESDNGIEIDSSDDIYNNTNMDDCSTRCSEDNIKFDASCIIRCNNADLESGYHVTSKHKKNEGCNCEEENDCIKHEISDDYFDQSIVMCVNKDEEHFVNVCPQNYATNDISRTLIIKESLGSSRDLDKVTDDSCHGDVVNNDDESDTVFDDKDDEKNGLYYDVSQFYRTSLPSDVGRGGQDGGDRDNFCLDLRDQRDHDMVVTGDDGGEDVAGPSWYAKNPHAAELIHVKDDDDDGEYFNVGYDNYTDSVHDDRHSCADDSIVWSRDNCSSKYVRLKGEPSQSYKYNKADKYEQPFKGQAGRERSMRPSPRKNAYFVLERDY